MAGIQAAPATPGMPAGRTATLDVTVIVPTRNRVDLLGRVLEAFLGQTHPAERFEIVVADDGSTDGTPALLAGIVRRVPGRVQAVRLDPRGPAAARNAGLEKARGQLILMVGDDIVPARELVAAHVRAHRAHGGGAQVAILGAAPFRGLEGRPTWMEEWLTRKHLGYPWLTPGEELPFYHFHTSNVSVGRELLQGVGGFDDAFPAAAAEDIELGRRLAAAGMRLYFHPEAGARHVHRMTLRGYRRRLLRTGEGLRGLARRHPDIRALAPPRRRRLAVLLTWNPIKAAYFALLYAWCVAWTLAGWHRAAGPGRAQSRS